ncbi:hypothetical protein Ancab_017529, partial [Ancistrocladus abbreviatus]
LWKMEAENLRGQLEELTTNHRQLKGEDISELGIEQIEHLEDQLEISSKTLRARKVQGETNDQKMSGSSRNADDLNNTYDFFAPTELQLSQPETAEQVNSPKRK